MGRPSAPNAPGAHFLRSRFAFDLVRLAGVGPGDLVLDLGAGLGAVTAPLAATGARVVAVERHEEYVRSLRRRFAGAPNVSVVAGDLLAVPLPRRNFRVVANIPFATTTALLRRLLDPPGTRLVSAHLVLEYGAVRRAVSHPAAWWSARFDLAGVRRLRRDAFHPPPAVDAQVLAVARADLPAGAEPVLRDLLRLAAREPERPLRRMLAGRLGAGQLRALGLDPAQPAGSVSGTAWRAIVAGVRNRGTG